MNTTSATEEMVQSISELPTRLGAGACFGTAIERDGHTMIPVARVSFGYGMGFGRGSGGNAGYGPSEHGDAGEGEGGGGGGGGSSTPVAVIDITHDDVTITPIMDPMRTALSGMMLGGWIAFWLFWTMRTISRERNKTRRTELSKSGAA